MPTIVEIKCELLKKGLLKGTSKFTKAQLLEKLHGAGSSSTPAPKAAKAAKAPKAPPPPPTPKARKPRKKKKDDASRPISSDVKELTRCKQLFKKFNIKNEAELKKYIITHHPDKGKYELDSEEANEYKEISNCFTIIKSVDDDQPLKEKLLSVLF
jgi:hypothetical protein